MKFFLISVVSLFFTTNLIAGDKIFECDFKIIDAINGNYISVTNHTLLRSGNTFDTLSFKNLTENVSVTMTVNHERRYIIGNINKIEEPESSSSLVKFDYDLPRMVRITNFSLDSKTGKKKRYSLSCYKR